MRTHGEVTERYVLLLWRCRNNKFTMLSGLPVFSAFCERFFGNPTGQDVAAQ